MTKDEFTNVINLADSQLERKEFLCHIFKDIFDDLGYSNSGRFYEDDETNPLHYVMQTRDAWGGPSLKYSTELTSLYDPNTDKNFKQNKHLALEFFYQYCLSEKFYKELT